MPDILRPSCNSYPRSLSSIFDTPWVTRVILRHTVILLQYTTVTSKVSLRKETYWRGLHISDRTYFEPKQDVGNRQLHSFGPEPSSEEVHQMIGNYGSLSMTCPMAAFSRIFPPSDPNSIKLPQTISNYFKPSLAAPASSTSQHCALKYWRRRRTFWSRLGAFRPGWMGTLCKCGWLYIAARPILSEIKLFDHHMFTHT